MGTLGGPKAKFSMKVNGLVPLDFQELSERLIVAPTRGDRGLVEDPHTFQAERYPVRREWCLCVP